MRFPRWGGGSDYGQNPDFQTSDPAEVGFGKSIRANAADVQGDAKANYDRITKQTTAAIEAL